MMTELQRVAAIKRLEQLEGYNPLQLAEFLGVWRNAVIYRLKKAGVYNRLTPLSERKAEFLELCDEEL